MENIRLKLEELKEAHLYRELKTVTSAQGASVMLGKKEYILLSSNNYLGLADDERITRAAGEALTRYGFGAGASRLISGTMAPHVELERAIAKFKGTEAALLFNSGYSANLGLISALAGRNDVIFSDKLNHASIIDASILSHTKVRRYPHKDMEILEKFLKNSNRYARRMIVTDGVFSMDGDIAPLKEIVELAEKYDTLVIVDDAHATGALGENGRGTLEHLGVESDRVIQMGTLSKALGCFGAFVAGKRDLIDYLINKSRAFIYTTALPPAIAAAALAAIRIAKSGKKLRKKLFENVEFMRDGLIDAGFKVPNHDSQIIPVVIGKAEETLKLSQHLYDNGVFIQAIRPPTVPKGTCRLRITPTAAHTKEQLRYALDVMRGYVAQCNLGGFPPTPPTGTHCTSSSSRPPQ